MFFLIPNFTHNTQTFAQESEQLTIEKPADVVGLINYYALKYDIDPALPLAIAKAESGLVINAKNSHSSASGLFQYINSTFEYFCIKKYGIAQSMADKNNPDFQAHCAVRMLADGGESHWNESRHVWGKSFKNSL